MPGMLSKVRIKKGDTVKIIAGRDLGSEGKVVSVLPDRGRLTVENLNLVKKAMRPDPRTHSPGGVVPMPAPIQISNVMLVCPRCSRPTRVNIIVDKQGKPHRKCKKCNELIDE
ncbi:MAG: 50S ribosomal protein L24 [bacterium]